MLDNKPQPTSLDAPIPGQSLTATLGERPWQNPPRYSTVEQAIQFYMPRLTSQRQAAQLMDLLEMGIPVDTVVDTIQLGGVMEGVHSADVGILVSPILAEAVEQMAYRLNTKMGDSYYIIVVQNTENHYTAKIFSVDDSSTDISEIKEYINKKAKEMSVKFYCNF